MLKRIGKFARDNLLSRGQGQIRHDLGQLDEEAFDSGLVIGHHDFRLLGDETSEMVITFPHQTLQEIFPSCLYPQYI